MNIFECPNCGVRFEGEYSFWGHRNKCGRPNEFVRIRLNSISSAFPHMNKPSNVCDDYEDDDCDYFEEPVEEVVSKVEGKYKLFQDAILCSRIQMTKSMPAVKLTDGTYVQGNRRIYNNIVKYTSKRTHLSEDDNTELIKMVKIISRINEAEIALPSRLLLVHLSWYRFRSIFECMINNF